MVMIASRRSDEVAPSDIVGLISRLLLGDSAAPMPVRTHRISAVTTRHAVSIQRRVSEPVIDKAVEKILCPVWPPKGHHVSFRVDVAKRVGFSLIGWRALRHLRERMSGIRLKRSATIAVHGSERRVRRLEPAARNDREGQAEI